jgi:hypothetical protein
MAGEGGLSAAAGRPLLVKGTSMSELERPNCPECAGEFDLSVPEVDRRNFIRVVGGGTAAALAGAALGGAALPGVARAAAPFVRKPKPAEDLIKELFSGLSDAQKRRAVRSWDNRARLGMFNNPIEGIRIESVYTPAQTELIERIVKSMCSGDEGYRRISRNNRWDNSGSLKRCGGMIFGNPLDGKFAFVFAGHHLTIRCDGNSEEGAAFGGPMYYGHSPFGYSRGNIFYFQTQSALSVFESLNEAQRKKAIVRGNPGEGAPSVRYRGRGATRPGIRSEDLTRDQRALVEKVMRDLLSPYRREDADEVMDIVRANGGMDKIHMAYYPDRGMNTKAPWHFWRLEGPGFVWNYRVLDHVHCYVNISSKI